MLSKLLTSPCGSESEGCVSDMNFLFTAEPELWAAPIGLYFLFIPRDRPETTDWPSAFDKLHRTIINFSGSSKNRVVRRCLSRGRASIWQDWTRKSGQSNSFREATPAAKNDQITAFKTNMRDSDVYFRLLAALVDTIPIIRDSFIMTAEPIG